MNSKSLWTIAVALVVVIASVSIIVSVSGVLSRGVLAVQGGTVLSRSGGEATIRCLSPDVNLTVKDFPGRIAFTNCFEDSTLTGFNGTVVRNGTTLSFVPSRSSGHYELKAPEKTSFSFAVMGDSQGHNDILRLALNGTSGCDFVIHCGDLVPSGARTEYAAVEAALNTSSVPVMTARGNHDVMFDGASEYASRFGPSQFWFDYGGVRFAVVDSSDEEISAGEIEWLGSVLSGATRTVIVTHVPSFDPFGDNHTLDSASCDRLQQFALEHGVTAVFSGHIHAFYEKIVDGTQYVITGGAGGALVSGDHHFVRVSVTPNSFGCSKVDIVQNTTAQPMITISGRTGVMNETLAELGEMPQLQGNSSYQNRYGNVGGAGHYVGVSVSSLVDLVGGMQIGDVLNVTATDGYYQTFGYGNVYPNTTWLSVQGPMVLALEYNGNASPGWQDGPRLAMLPSDGLYSNSDCQQTSYPGQGYSVYQSAGARWVSNVESIVVEAHAP